MSAPFVGKRVTIEGLASRPELNGQTATAESFDSGKCRYNVRLRDGSMIALRPASLIAVPGQSDDAGGGGSPFGGFGGMPGMGGGMPDMAQAQAVLQQLQAMLPAGVTPQRAGMIVLGVAFIAWRFLSLKMLLVLGAIGYVVCTKLFAAEFAAAGGGAKGAVAAGRACVQKVRARLSAATGFQVTETHALIAIALAVVIGVSVVSRIAGGRGTGGAASAASARGARGAAGESYQPYDAYAAGYRDGETGKEYGTSKRYDEPPPPSSGGGGGGGSRFGMGSLFNLGLLGKTVYDLGGRPWSPQNVLVNVRNMQPMQMMMTGFLVMRVLGSM